MGRVATLFAAVTLSAPILVAMAASSQPDSAAISEQALGPSGLKLGRPALASAQPVTAPHAMVVTTQHLATEVGVDILRHGGNAVDAAVAIGYALAVVHPCCGNIGGGGFMTIHLAGGKNLFLDFREKAPLKATVDMFRNAQDQVVRGRSIATYLAVGVPGTVMGLEAARTAYGTMTRQQLMAPAIALAEQGYVLTDADATFLDFSGRRFAQHPNVAAIFLHDGKPYQAGERLQQVQLAHTLRMIEQKGPRVFYHGKIARDIVAASGSNGGLLSMRDFADYTVEWDKPVTCDYRGYEIVSAAPPSSGGTTVCEILQIIKPYPLDQWGYASVATTHYLVEAERHAYADRNTYLGDPAFVKNPVAALLSPSHAAAIRAQIKPDVATPTLQVQGSLGAAEGLHTTHYSVVDAKGNAVAVTYTLNLFFGNGQIAGDTGFFLNDEMDDFTSKPGVPNSFGLVQGQANAIAAGKRPLSSMAPTIVLKDGKLFMVTGSPGGSTIISTTLESILNVVDFGMNMQQAVNAPRVHDQWLPDVVMVEPDYLTSQSRAALEKMGYSFRMRPSWGADEAILRDPKTGLLEGANDDRRAAGLAAGY
ncbi:MAG TPA: gamma-glutamyltransferase [Steroidobacteraceae bacterium]|nr:gamma-glutamyltransferase [Steroidobacteraceae bacterium]